MNEKTEHKDQPKIETIFEILWPDDEEVTEVCLKVCKGEIEIDVEI